VLLLFIRKAQLVDLCVKEREMFLFLTVQKYDKVYLVPTESDIPVFNDVQISSTSLYATYGLLINLMWFYLYLIFQLKEMLLQKY
jgi:hypothetical protein